MTQATIVGIGDRLANGGIVLQLRPCERYTDGVVFLALSHREFVTWIGRPDGSDTTWGNYHGGNLAAALADYGGR